MIIRCQAKKSEYKLAKTNDPLKEVLKYFENHPSITNIKSKILMQILLLEILVPLKVVKLIKTLNVSKASQQSDIPFKIAKLNADFF